MKSFAPNCTLPSESAFVKTPNVRSTLDIVWSCLAVVLISTWSVQHLNVPVHVRPQTTVQSIRFALYLLRRKLRWMLVTVMAPELRIALAATNLVAAVQNSRELGRLARDDGVPWSMAHTSLADMGGIVLRFAPAVTGDVGGVATAAAAAAAVVVVRGGAGSVEAGQEENGANNQSSDVDGATAMPAAAAVVAVSGSAGSVEAGSVGAGSVEAGSVEAGQEENGTNNQSSDGHGATANPTTNPTDDRIDDALHRWRTKHLARRKYGDLLWQPHPPHVSLIKQVTKGLAAHGYDILANEIDTANLLALQGDTWAVDARQLALARQHGLLGSLPTLYPDDIADKAKADGLVKTLAVLQAAWLAVQLLVRQTAGLPSTALELSSLAFAACAIVSYLAEWFRPKDVATPFYFDVPPDKTLTWAVFQRIALSGPKSDWAVRLAEMPNQSYHMPPAFNSMSPSLGNQPVLLYGGFMGLAGALFGGVHAAGWNLQFPTPIEGELWRGSVAIVLCSSFTAASMALAASLAFHDTGYSLSSLRRTTSARRRGYAVRYCFAAAFSFLALVYAFARLFLLVESFRSLYYLPTGAFASTWSAGVPHLG